MYLILASDIVQTYTVNYQSVGREIITLSGLKALEMVSASSEVLVFYDKSLELQKLLDLYYLLDLKYRIIVNRKDDEDTFKGLFPVYLIDYKTIDGSLIRAIKSEDFVALESLQKSKNDRTASTFKLSYLDEVRSMMNSSGATNNLKSLANAYLNLSSEFIELKNRYVGVEEEFQQQKREVFSLRQALAKYSIDMKSFIQYFTNLQNKYKAMTALSVIRDSNSMLLPQHVTTLYMKDYGIPNVHLLLSALYDSLTIFYKKYVKVVYIAEADGIAVNLIPSNYKLITNTVNQSDIIIRDFLCCVGNVNIPLEFLFTSSAFNTLILVDARRNSDRLFKGETMFLNLAPDFHTVQALGLLEDETISPSRKSKYILKEDSISREGSYGSRNADLVNKIVNTLLERRGEI